jgi:glycine hydroxymethyltransferase
MKEHDMQDIAEFIKRVVIDKEDTARIAEEVAEFRRMFQNVHYSFDGEGLGAYEYISLIRD